MTGPSYTTEFSVDQSPKEAYEAITNPQGWWSAEIEGSAEKAGDEFRYHYEDLHRCTIRVTESVPGEKVTWHVVDNYFSFVKDSSEWVDTTMTFDISEEGGKTKVVFTHHGLVPEFECYNACQEGWGNYINGSLKDLIGKGQGAPNATGQAQTTAEVELGSASR
ncbi:SRPBCC domain-containing protein [Solwaraspora sp. WMMD792]|uniref:SRPBCC family protein n=1 Tax=unclassified Solwaraspora TaxID=2627926 RepID=UPI0024161CD3|nr:SRPBCC domain-containing protein [Solwaraspora sp. WMMD792]MDG4772687.1 SRPBCC domain-containing protein [Solwaraspora sp. WMMD792]